MAGDRLEMLLGQTAVTGIDFIHVEPAQTTLHVFFHVDPAALTPPWTAPVEPSQVRITSLSGRSARPSVPVTAAAWTAVDGRRALRIDTAGPGDFSRYALAIDSARLDRRYNGVPFSFKAGCPSDLDCEPPAAACPPEDSLDHPVAYLARDFWSLRRSLLEFAAQRYPDWKDRLEADVGVMLAEVMAAVGDEMAFYQDRIARQAFLATASERRSVRHLARLVDDEIDDGLAASTWLDVTVADAAIVEVPAGADVWAASDGGRRIQFEVGRSLSDQLAEPPVSWQVRGAWNSLAPHIWDEDETCLPWGATELWVRGHHAASLFPVGAASDRMLLLRTTPVDPSRPVRAHLVLVRAADVEEDRDHVFGKDVTRLAWDRQYATPFELDLEVLEVRANLVPVSAGATRSARFTIGYRTATEEAPAAVERLGPAEVTIYRHTLAGSDAIGLCWIDQERGTPRPDVRLFELVGAEAARGTEWEWRRSLVGVASSDLEDRHFTLEDGSWDTVLEWERPGATIRHVDYRSAAGFTIRFGDDEFGRLPPVDTRFEVFWRLGNGTAGNVAAGTLVHTELADPASPLFAADIVSVSNPLPAGGGRDPETLEQVRRRAPEAFRALTFRAVQAEDHAEAVERLDGIQRAGAELRWTGSWPAVFCTPDPRGTSTLSPALREEVQDQLDRFRQAGREANVRAPVYAFLDLDISICLEPTVYPGEVEPLIRIALLGEGHPWSPPGFFHPDRFTFGTRLERSQLEAAVHAVPGVRAIESIRIRRRGHFPFRDFVEPWYQPGANEVLGLEDDPLYPERGSLRLVMEGGA